jgi:hypothetical protein
MLPYKNSASVCDHDQLKISKNVRPMIGTKEEFNLKIDVNEIVL